MKCGPLCASLWLRFTLVVGNVPCIFELELLAFYLADPFEFAYYWRQRTELSGNYKGDTEMSLLGMHLKQELFKNKEAAFEAVDSSFAQLVDVNFPVLRGSVPKTSRRQTTSQMEQRRLSNSRRSSKIHQRAQIPPDSLTCGEASQDSGLRPSGRPDGRATHQIPTIAAAFSSVLVVSEWIHY